MLKSHFRIFLLLLGLGGSLEASADLIKDLALTMGSEITSSWATDWVVGLAGTGDQTIQAPFTVQSLQNMLIQLGITVPQGAQLQQTTWRR